MDCFLYFFSLILRWHTENPRSEIGILGFGADADAETREVFSYLLNDGFKAVVGASTPLLSQSDGAAGEIDIIADDENLIGRAKFVEVDHFPNSLSRDIHICLGLYEQDGACEDTPLSNVCIIFRPVFPRTGSEVFCEDSDGQETGVVSGLFVGFSRIPKADDDK